MKKILSCLILLTLVSCYKKQDIMLEYNMDNSYIIGDFAVKDDKVYYVFLDEIQKVEDFEKAINSLRVENNFSIFVTGSNSRVTVMELSTELTRKIC